MHAVALPSIFVECPDIFGQAVSARAVRVDTVASGLATPAHLVRAHASRVREFLAGRVAAEVALAAAGCAHGEVAVGVEGSPLWPAGFVGSIAHTRDIACAAVARSSGLRGMGIDVEPVMSESTLAEVAPLVVVDDERRWLDGSDRLPVATLLFSAKESLYKCLRPLAGTFFDFQDACVDDVDLARGRWRIRLLRDLPGFPRGFTLEGRVALEQGRVHTAVELPS